MIMSYDLSYNFIYYKYQALTFYQQKTFYYSPNYHYEIIFHLIH